LANTAASRSPANRNHQAFGLLSRSEIGRGNIHRHLEWFETLWTDGKTDAEGSRTHLFRTGFRIFIGKNTAETRRFWKTDQDQELGSAILDDVAGNGGIDHARLHGVAWKSVVVCRGFRRPQTRDHLANAASYVGKRFVAIRPGSDRLCVAREGLQKCKGRASPIYRAKNDRYDYGFTLPMALQRKLRLDAIAVLGREEVRAYQQQDDLRGTRV